MIVVLIGYMASGKSTVGKILAKKLNYAFIDLDNFIEEKEKTTVNNIFKTKGEIYFRKIEAIHLKSILDNEHKIVLSLGGGTPCYGNNMDDLQNTKNVTSIYLKASIPTLVSRLENEKEKRPLISHLKSQEALTEFIGKHMFERSSYYNQANLMVNTDNKSTTEILEELVFRLF